MKKKRFSVEQIVSVLKQAELDVPVAEVIRRLASARRSSMMEESNTLIWRPISWSSI